jgi:hypothetical protein
MPDILVQTSNLPDLNKMAATNKPSYLVQLDSGKKIPRLFLASKMDEGPRFLKCVGFYYGGSEENVAENYATLITEKSIADFVEMQFPYEKVISVRSLVYRHKGGK